MIDQLIEDLKRDEGWVPHAYEDSRGWLTIGYGFLIDKRKGGQMPISIGEHWLEFEANLRWTALMDRIPWIVDQPEPVQRAVGNMAYQLGISGLMGFKRMLAALERGDRGEAAREALASRWAAQTPVRAQRVAMLIRGSRAL